MNGAVQPPPPVQGPPPMGGNGPLMGGPPMGGGGAGGPFMGGPPFGGGGGGPFMGGPPMGGGGGPFMGGPPMGGFPGGPNQGMNQMNMVVPPAVPGAPICQPFSINLPGAPNGASLYILGCIRFFRGYVCGTGPLNQPTPQPTCQLPELNPSCPNTIATLPGLNVQSFGCYGNSEAPSDLFCGSNIQCMASSTVGKPENENPQPEETPESIQQEGEAEKLRFSLWKLMILTLIFLLYLPFQ